MLKITPVILLLLLASCSPPAGNRPPATIPGQKEVIDHPAVVVITGQNSRITKELKEVKKAAIFSDEHHIPLVSTSSENLEFIKQNGTRVELNIRSLPGNHRIILFNMVNDPVPCSPDDLLTIPGSFFREQVSSDKPKARLHAKIRPPHVVSDNESQPEPILRNDGKEIPVRKMKRMMIEVADTAQSPLKFREVPGITWIENRIDMRTSLMLTFENDILTWNNTDRYFTNGITIELKAPWISRLAVTRIMLPYRHHSQSNTNLFLVQNMYTSADTRIPPTLQNDRPFASYIFSGIRKTNIDNSRKIRLGSSFYAGVIGPYSPGSFLQTLVHKTFPTNDIPQGWETQINSDIILNYSVSVEKRLFESGLLSMSALANAEAGTLYTYAGSGFRTQFGISEPRFGFPGKVERIKWQAYIYALGEANLIAYDATLQGGIINKNNVYTLNSSQLKCLTGKAEIGVHLEYRGYGFEAAQHFLTPEFISGMPHRWGRFSLLFPL